MKRQALRVLSSVLVLASATIAQERSARFDAPVIVGDTQTRFQKLADINGDGYLDAFSGWWRDNSYSSIQVTAFINDGAGKLNPTWTRTASVNPAGTTFWAFAAGDVDLNGRADIVFGAGRYLWLFLTALDGSSQLQQGLWSTFGGPDIHGVALIDVDGDGVPEIAVLHGDLTILRYDTSAPGFLVPIATLPLAAVNGELQTTDVNGDGQPDLMAWDATRVMMIPIIGGQPQLAQTFIHGCSDPKAQAGDLDGDGDIDVVVFDMGTYVLLRRTGPATFVQEGPFVGGPARFLFDVNGDGFLDGVCCGGGGGLSPVQNYNPSIFRIAINDGTGHFAPAIEFPGLGSERLAGAGDLDHDGDLDLVAGRNIYYGSKRMLDGLPRAASVPNPCIERFADIDGDADPDLDPGTTTQRNAGDGTFAAFTPVLPVAPAGMSYFGRGYPGDFDGDGDIDLVVALRQNGAFVQMELLENMGGGSFVDAGPAGPLGLDFTYALQTEGPQARDVLAVDADGDGDIDLVVRGYPTQGATKIFWNDGSGHFTAGPAWPDMLITHVADVNGDGRPDLVGWQSYAQIGSQNNIGIILAGQPGGTFAAAQQLGLMNTTTPFTDVFDVGDADGDGDLDIVFKNFSYVALLLNNGQAAINFNLYSTSLILATDASSSYDGPQRALFVDVDGDGKLDVVASPVGTYYANPNGAPNGCMILRRRSDNSGYEAPTYQVMQPTAKLDVDGDGDTDLVGTHVWKNRHFEGVDGGMRKQSGSGTPGAGGVVPTLGAHGPFRVGQSAEIKLSGATGGTTGFLQVADFTDPPPVFQGGAHMPVRGRPIIQVAVNVSGAPGSIGTGRWSLPYTVPAYTAGRTKDYRVVLNDPWSAHGSSQTNDLFITYGP